MVQPLLHLLSDDTTVLRLTKVVVTILMMDRVLLFVICEPLLQKQTTVLFPTINLNSEMQLSKIMINTTVKYMADPRQIWQCLYYEDSPPVSLPKARSQDRDLRHPSPRRTRSTGGETSQTTSIGSSIHCIGPDTEYLQKLSHLFTYWSSFKKLDTIKFVKTLSE